MRRLADQAAVALANARMLEQVRELAYYDSLTGLPTRLSYKERLAYALEQASARLERLRNHLAEGRRVDAPGPDPFVAECRERFLAALADDFNTPRAWAAIFDLAGAAFEELLPLLGLESLLEPQPNGAEDPEVAALLAEREQARAERDFERADRIRDQLAARGWAVRDTAQGARLVRTG